MFTCCVYVCVCLLVYMCSMCIQVPYSGQRRASHPLELGLQTVVSHYMWMLGTQSARAASVTNC